MERPQSHPPSAFPLPDAGCVCFQSSSCFEHSSPAEYWIHVWIIFSPFHLPFFSVIVWFHSLSPLGAYSVCLGSALALSSNSICQPARGSRGFTAGRRKGTRHYTASQPRRVISPLKVMSFLALGRRDANCSAVGSRTKLPDLPQLGNKRIF